MWNISGYLVDYSERIEVKFNSEVVEKLTRLTPREGMLLFLENYYEFWDILKTDMN